MIWKTNVLNLFSSLPYTELMNNLLIEQLNLSLGCLPLGKSVECISKYTWDKHQVRQQCLRMPKAKFSKQA